MPASNAVPVEVTLETRQRQLILHYADGETIVFTHEFLRVNSPSAEVQGHHGVGGELPLDKGEVVINDVEAVGNYALRLRFSDGHDSGIYSWSLFARYALEQESLMSRYRAAVAAKTSRPT